MLGRVEDILHALVGASFGVWGFGTCELIFGYDLPR